MLLALLSTASAEDFTVVSEDQPAPFEGVLLSVPAVAEVLAQHEEVQMKCDLEIEYQLDDLVINKQQAIIKKGAPHRKWLWFAGGIVLGGASYYGIEQAVNQ
jgi:hypothetical protein